MSELTRLQPLLARLARFVADAGQRPPTLNLRPMAEIAAALQLEQSLDRSLADIGPEAFVEAYLQYATRLHSAGFLAHQTAPPNAGSTLAALLDGVVSNPMAVYEMGPAAATIEYWLLNHLLTLVGWSAPPWPEQRTGDDIGRHAAGVLVHGGSLATLTALLAARTRVQPDVWQRGNDASLCLICAEGAHYAVARAAGIMGLGRSQVLHAAADARGALTVPGVQAALSRARDEGRRVLAVVATACSTSVGAFDPLRGIAQVCREAGVWLHVDAAHGGALLASPALRWRLDGIELADSLVWDAHKMMRTGPLCTAALFRDERAINAAFEQEASYLFHAKALPGFDFLHRTVECTKAALGLRWYLALAWQGEAAIARYIESRVALTHQLWQQLQADPDFECAIEPEANILCFRPCARRGEELALRDALILRGEHHLSTTMFAGERWLRIVVMSPATTLDSLHGLLRELLAHQGNGPASGQAQRPGEA